MGKITGYLVDVVNKTNGPVEVDGTLEDYYRVLNCDIFDITNREIGRKRFDIMCDDEGLLKSNPIPSALDVFNRCALVGNLFIVKHDEEGNTVSLTFSEIEYIDDYVYKVGLDARPMLTEVDY